MNFAKIINKKYHMDINVFIFFFTLFNILAFNNVFFNGIYAISKSITFVCSAFVIATMLIILFCLIIFYKKTVKPLSYIFLIINSGIYYFINSYHVAINEEMLINVLQTNIGESFDLLNSKFLLYIIIYGLVPIFIIRQISIDTVHFWKRKFIYFTSILITLSIILITFASTIFPFAHEHKPLKYFFIPVNYIGAITSYIKHTYRDHKEFTYIGENSSFDKYWNNEKKLLIVFIVGETARAENFSFNNYERNTNEPLNKYIDDIINYTNAYSCGTSTAVSVPCMFSKDSQQNFVRGSAEYTENVLDILKKNNYNVIWFENNSDCKDVCNRVEQVFPCPYLIGSCTDDVILLHMKEKITETNDNTFVALHQIGSHGPKYYARYPKKFAMFKPTCQTDKINECSKEELINTYDNTIAYTSQNIAETIKKVKKLKNDYNVILFYVSDHGESLGENGFYLHSAPISVAPKEQIHIPFFIWAEDETWKDLNIDKQCLKKSQNNPVSHDNIFHSLLGISGISAPEYDSNLDLFYNCKKH